MKEVGYASYLLNGPHMSKVNVIAIEKHIRSFKTSIDKKNNTVIEFKVHRIHRKQDPSS